MRRGGQARLSRLNGRAGQPDSTDGAVPLVGSGRLARLTGDGHTAAVALCRCRGFLGHRQDHMPKTLPARALAPVLVVIVALAGCAAPPPAPPPALKRIEGTQWVSTERSAGGLGVSYTFLSGGRVVENQGAIIDFDYRVEGEQLVLSVNGSERRSRYAVDGARLTLRGDDGIERVHQRAGPRSSPPLLQGLWTFRHDSGAPADIFFGTRGRGLMRVLTRQREGSYRLADDGTFQVQFDGGSARALAVSIEGGAMEVRGGQKALRLRRVSTP